MRRAQAAWGLRPDCLLRWSRSVSVDMARLAAALDRPWRRAAGATALFVVAGLALAARVVRRWSSTRERRSGVSPSRRRSPGSLPAGRARGPASAAVHRRAGARLCVRALVGHAILGYGTSATGPMRVLVATGYWRACAARARPAVTEASPADCFACPRIPRARGRARRRRVASTVGLALAAAVGATVVVVAAVRVARASTAARRLIAPVVVPGVIAIAAFGWTPPGASRAAGWRGRIDRATWVSGRRPGRPRFGSVARSSGAVGPGTHRAIVLDLAGGPRRVGCRTGFARARRPRLVLAYPTGDGRSSTPGRAAPPLDGAGRHATRWSATAMSSRSSGIGPDRAGPRPDDRDRGRCRPRAGPRAARWRNHGRASPTSAPRVPGLSAGDRERARLERDLHDGAQQRLAGLALAVRVARSGLATGGAGTEASRLARDGRRGARRRRDRGPGGDRRPARRRARDLSRGAGRHGSRPAVVALAERDPWSSSSTRCQPERLPVPVEATAYLVIAEAPVRAGPTRRHGSEVVDGRLRLRLVLDGAAGRAWS